MTLTEEQLEELEAGVLPLDAAFSLSEEGLFIDDLLGTPEQLTLYFTGYENNYVN